MIAVTGINCGGLQRAYNHRVATQKTYRQNCPVALGLDILGERWTLLILRELMGGARRYSDLRSELPGIATNLLADRLRLLEEVGLVSRLELPPPIARTVYELSDIGWLKVTPVVKAIADFGMDRVDVGGPESTPLSGFLTGLLLGFDSASANDLRASYRFDIDGRTFEFSVGDGRLAAGYGVPAVEVTATATDLIMARLAPTASRRRSAIRRMRFEGDDEAVASLRRAFQLSL